MRTWPEQKEAEREMRREWLRSIVKSGKRSCEIESIIGCDRSSVARMARELGVDLQWGKDTKRGLIDADRLIEQLRAGKTRRELSLHFGVSVQAISHAIKRNGFTGVEKTVKRRMKPQKEAEKPEPKQVKNLTPLEQMKLDAQAANKRLRGGQ